MARSHIPRRPSCQSGLTLIEVLIATAILGAVGVAFLFGLTTAYKSVTVSAEVTTMESLAKSALEDAKAQPYIGGDKCPNHQEYRYLGQPPWGYAVTITATCIDATGMETDKDKGLQLITVSVTRQGKEDQPLQLSGYKVKPPQ